MFHTNIPLNQKMSAPVILVNDQQLEGGEELDEDMTTERGMTTNRNLVVQTDAVLITQTQSNDREKTSKIHLQRIREEAQLRLEIEGFVKVNCRYSTLYEGLKLNTARNSAISQPLAFMLRRFIYAVVIVFMQSAPQVGILVMIAVSTLMLNFTIFEQPWK